jgi:hypothetical protein
MSDSAIVPREKLKMAQFDEAQVEQPTGMKQRMSYEEFFKLPLMHRVKLLSDRKVQFFKAGRPVSAADAIK